MIRLAAASAVCGLPIWLSMARGGSVAEGAIAAVALLLVLVPTGGLEQLREVRSIVIPVGALVAWIALVTPASGGSIDGSLLVSVLLFTAALLATTRVDAATRDTALIAIAVASTLHAIATLATLLARAEPFAMPSPDGWRAGGLLTYANMLAIWLGVGIVISVDLARRRGSWWWPLAVLQLLALTMTGSRYAVVAVLIVLVVSGLHRTTAQRLFDCLVLISAVWVVFWRGIVSAPRLQTWAQALDRTVSGSTTAEGGVRNSRGRRETQWRSTRTTSSSRSEPPKGSWRLSSSSSSRSESPARSVRRDDAARPRPAPH